MKYSVRHLQSHNLNATSPAKTQRLTNTQCSSTRLLNFEDGGNTILRSIRNCVTSHKNQTISNTAERTLNHTTVNPAVCLSVCLNFPIQLPFILLTSCQLYSHCNCLQYCFVSNVYCITRLSFKLLTCTQNSFLHDMFVKNHQTLAPVSMQTLAVAQQIIYQNQQDFKCVLILTSEPLFLTDKSSMWLALRHLTAEMEDMTFFLYKIERYLYIFSV